MDRAVGRGSTPSIGTRSAVLLDVVCKNTNSKIKMRPLKKTVTEHGTPVAGRRERGALGEAPGARWRSPAPLGGETEVAQPRRRLLVVASSWARSFLFQPLIFEAFIMLPLQHSFLFPSGNQL